MVNMRVSIVRLVSAVSAGLLIAGWNTVAVSPAQAQITLTGMTLYNSTSDGTFSGGFWDTVAGNFSYNVYLYTGTSAAPVFLNSGDTTATLTPNFTMAAPGTYVFNFAATTSPSTYYGMNLYFDGNATDSRMTAVTQALSSSFSQVGPGVSTFGLSSSSAPSANSLTYAGLNGFTATLSDFRLTQVANGGNIDLVRPYDNSVEGALDNIGQFTITVNGPVSTAAPEPGSLALLLPVMGTAGIVIWKQKRHYRKS